jgi:hypothetical protein
MLISEQRSCGAGFVPQQSFPEKQKTPSDQPGVFLKVLTPNFEEGSLLLRN